MSFRHRPPDSHEYEIVNEQASRYQVPRERRPNFAQRMLGHRDEDRTLRRALLVVTLCIGLISLTGSVWRAGTKINALVTTVQRVGPAFDSLGKQVRDLGTGVVILNTRVDSLTAHEARRDAVDSARFAALEKATAAVNRAAAVVQRERP